MENKLPVYKLVINELDDELGIDKMSFVLNPAVSIDFLKFGKEEDKLTFSNEEKRIITGVAILADTPIYRRNQYGEHYITFSPEAIYEIVQKFFKQDKTKSVNLDHSVNTNSAFIFESYLVNNERGITPKEFGDLPDGSWVVSYKITDNELWNDIKANKFNGFSIEGFFKYDSIEAKCRSE